MSARARGLFVTGTDTAVGKTEIACGLIRAARTLGWRVAGMKPIAAGARRVHGKLLNTDVQALIRASAVRVAGSLINPYLLAPAIAPHLGARDAAIRLDIGVIASAYRQLAMRFEVVIVEGAGGLFVPLNDRQHMADLAQRLRVPIILVVGMRLGCLSHALLSAEAIENRGLTFAGWVANRIDPSMRRYRDNVASLQQRLRAPLLAEVPFVLGDRARRDAVDRALDRARLAPWFAC